MSRRRYIAGQSRKVQVDSGLKALGKAVAMDLLRNNGVPVDEEWSLKKAIEFIKQNKNPETGLLYEVQIDRVLNPEFRE